MKEKNIQVEIPQYLTIGDWMRMSEYKGEDSFEKIIHTVVSLTNQTEDEVRQWSGDTLVEIANILKEKGSPKNEYHPLIEWNGELYGYRSLEAYTLGEYSDLEMFIKDPEKNLHKIAAIMYRPVTSHKFDSLSFMVKQSLRMVNNKVENIFDWFEVEKSDYKNISSTSEKMKDFPVHLILGAMGFFLNTGNLFLNDFLYLTNKVDLKTKRILDTATIKDLLDNIGAGSGLSTNSVRPTYFPLQETSQ